MRLEWPSLDDRQFQPLVDEMRKRIVRYCPEWTDYNLSDPGITLIELFAWLTDLTLYRLNQVPIKNYVAFLDLLGVQPAPAASAQVELTFRLSTPFADPSARLSTLIERHFPVSTRDRPGVDAPFTTVDNLVIVTPELRFVYAGLQEPLGASQPANLRYNLPFSAFATNPKHRNDETEVINEGAFFCLGLDVVTPPQPYSGSLAGHILRIHLECDPDKAEGMGASDPPLQWECWVKENQVMRWQLLDLKREEIEQNSLLSLNVTQGSITFYLPRTLHLGDPIISGQNAYWLRCRFKRQRASQWLYTASPQIKSIRVEVLGASVLARHASFVHEEVLGQSDGASGQCFTLQHVPVLALETGETIEVEESIVSDLPYPIKEYRCWQRVPTFAHSSRHDRHYCLDESSGQVTFGPGIIQPDGAVRQYGRIPEPGSRIRITRYRHGGGTVGNVPKNQITVMHKSAPYIDQVTNRHNAKDGRDEEQLAQTVMRAREKLFGPHRAVTAADFETLARRMTAETTTHRVARAKCITPTTFGQLAQREPTSANPASNKSGAPPLWPGAIQLLVTPDVADAVAELRFAALAPTADFCAAIRQYLDDYRLLTTYLEIAPPQYVAVKVATTIVRAADVTDAEIIRRVDEALRRYIAPLVFPADPLYGADLLPKEWGGWPFGQPLYLAELFAFIQKVPGVKHVLQVQMHQGKFDPATLLSDTVIDLSQMALMPVTAHHLEFGEDTLPCSLPHSITVTSL